jgi:putative ABC transport system permease protein
MSSLSTIRTAIRSLGRNKLRSALTALGLIIGVAAVISMIGIGNGAKAQVEAQVASLGQNLVMVYPLSSGSGAVRQGYGSSVTLTIDDAEAIEEEISEVVAVSPEFYGYFQAASSSQNWKTKVYGESPEYFDIRQWPVIAGEAFTESDVRSAAKVALLGQTAAQELFGEEEPIDETVRIQNVPLKVIGVLKAKGFSVKGHDQDNVIVVPFTTAQLRLLGKNASVYGINIQVDEASNMDSAKEKITELLRQRHRISSAKDDDFVVRSQQEVAEAAGETTRTMTILLGAIASVSLIVGGIGIMNIMLVSVTERTREIGIRMAVGARTRDILRQFLVEAFTLSSLGGLIGIVVGIGTSHILAAAAHWPTLVSVQAVTVAFCFSSAVGIFFGFYPARKASQLDPIDSLRYE